MNIVLHITTEEALRSSWIASSIEAYIEWLEGRHAARSTIVRRVTHLVRFGTFAREQGAGDAVDLCLHVNAFVESRVAASEKEHSSARWAEYKRELAGPIEQMLLVVGLVAPKPGRPRPSFGGLAEGFFDSLREERGLQPATIQLYRSHLAALEDHLSGRDVELRSLTPADVDGAVRWWGERMAVASIGSACSALRHLLRWLYRERRISRDLSRCVGKPQMYRLAKIPRSVPWEDVQRTLELIEQDTVIGKRDFAILMLLALYGMRAREVAALTLDDIDWRAAVLSVPRRKCDHSTRYPLSQTAGNALLAYLRVRPAMGSRSLFILDRSPFHPIDHHVVSVRARHHLRRAGVTVHRPGSHTFRHSCAQRLLEADFSFKVIGDYLGHSVPSSTEIYTKVAIESLRKVALGNGEEVLCPSRH